LPNILKNKFFFRQYLAGTTRAQCTPELTSFKVVEFGMPWYGSIQLLGRIETYQDVPDLTPLNEVISLRYIGFALH